jgi:Ca2+-transporting ATPase
LFLGWIEGASILIAVFLVTTVNAVNDYSKDKQFRMLEKAKENDFVFVIRDGEETQVRVFDLVVGDIVLLQRGDKVPADGIMIQSAGNPIQIESLLRFCLDQLRMDESNLTGESEAVKKDPERDPFLLSGSIVSEGDTRMLVLAVGTRSQWGKIILDLSSEDDPTPLQEHLDNLAASKLCM